MHIGIVHYTAPPVVGGVESTIFHHTRILSELGHKVTVVAGKGADVLPVTYQEEPLVGSDNEIVLKARQTLTRGEVPRDFESLVSQIRVTMLNHLSACDVVIGHNLFTMPQNLMLTAAVYQLVG